MTSGSEGGAPPDKRKHPRYELSLLVQFRFDTFEDFLAEYASNISMGGMFIRTQEVREEGALIYLQFYLRDGQKFIEGLGRVVRVVPPGQAEAAGMGVEFVNFDEPSMEVISEICEARRQGGPQGR